MNTFPKMAEIVKPAKLGCAEVTHYTVTKLDVLREMMHGGPCEEGTVAILRVAGRTMMSDTKHEKITNYEILRQAHGNVLIAGLGLGMILHPILACDRVASVTVVEQERDVIKLISPTLPVTNKLQVHCGDIFTWMPPVDMRYDCIYFDIWADGSTDLAKIERRKLGQRFRRFKAPEAWLGYWRPLKV